MTAAMATRAGTCCGKTCAPRPCSPTRSCRSSSAARAACAAADPAAAAGAARPRAVLWQLWSHWQHSSRQQLPGAPAECSSRTAPAAQLLQLRPAQRSSGMQRREPHTRLAAWRCLAGPGCRHRGASLACALLPPAAQHGFRRVSRGFRQPPSLTPQGPYRLQLAMLAPAADG